MNRYLTAGVLLVLAAVIFSGCRRSAPTETVPPETAPAPTRSVETKPMETTPSTAVPEEPAFTAPDNVSSRGQLMGSAKTLEDAQALAELYGIELVEYRHELALFRTEEDPREVIRRGRDNGWPGLSLNGTVQAY